MKDFQTSLDNVDVKTLAHWRLRMLESKFDLFTTISSDNDEDEQLQPGEHRDFYQTHKVDTHIHMAAGMTAKSLLEFIQDKAKNHDHDLVSRTADGKAVTLGELFEVMQVMADPAGGCGGMGVWGCGGGGGAVIGVWGCGDLGLD